MKTDKSGVPAARQDLMCRLLEEGRQARPHAGDTPAAGIGGDDTTALKTMVRSSCYVSGLLLLGFTVKAVFPWSGTREDIAKFVFGVLLCLVLPLWGYAWTSHWDDDD